MTTCATRSGFLYLPKEFWGNMLSDSQHKKEAAARRKELPKVKKKKNHSDETKINAAKAFLVLGSIKLVSATLKIPEPTLFIWKRTEWWGNLIKELQIQENIVLSAKLKNIVEKSHEVVLDRLENGEFIYDQKAGKLIRKPVALRDAHKVAVDLTNQREMLKITEQVQVAEEDIKTKLDKLMVAFSEAVKAKPSVEVTDVVFVKEVENGHPDSSS